MKTDKGKKAVRHDLEMALEKLNEGIANERSLKCFVIAAGLELARNDLVKLLKDPSQK